MNSVTRASVFVLLLIIANGVALFATCGGGGGGGAGGAGAGGMGSNQPEVYRVPWKILEMGGKPPFSAALAVLWFPTSLDGVKTSDMLTSRSLTLAAARDVLDLLVTPEDSAARQRYNVPAGQEVALLLDREGKELARAIPNAKGRLEARAVDKLLNQEIANREKSLKSLLDAAEKKAKAGDAAAVADLEKVWSQRTMFPSLGKRAAKALEKAGRKVGAADLERLGPDHLSDPDLTGRFAAVERLLRAGLDAELAARYDEAGKKYAEAVALDPADPTALRFLGEFYRHHTGEWNKAGRIFRQILAQPSDPVARAVALHGLGKMTIHAGRFQEGLRLFEESLASCPLPITYRNLAVYWFSEKQPEKATAYMQQALALAPDDAYNRVFAAVYLAAAGRHAEAQAIARDNEALLDASYNLAAIWAQAGDKQRAMELLRRHFFTYERFEAVRAMEMKEAREDYMFAQLYDLKEFDELTRGAKNAWMFGLEWCDPSELQPVQGPPGPRVMQ